MCNTSHYDKHDVFAIQVDGEKHWNLYANRADYPILHERYPQLTMQEHDRAKGPVGERGNKCQVPRDHQLGQSPDGAGQGDVGVGYIGEQGDPPDEILGRHLCLHPSVGARASREHRWRSDPDRLPIRFRCPDCGEPTDEVVAGRELELVALELADDPDTADGAATPSEPALQETA